MALRRRVVLATPALLATTAILAAAGVLGATHPAAAQTAAQQTAQQTTGFRTATITAADGTALEANVIEPATAGRHPAIVFISSWGLNDAEYLAQATAFAQAGYTVLSYTTRGFWGSGGQIDTAGPKDIADVSSVLDWLIAHTGADPGRIGVAGVSYGAGIGLIASAADPRIRAVAAMSGWTDLVESLYGGNTRRPQAAFLLAALARLTGRPSAELTANLDDYFANRDVDAVKAWARIRGAATYVGAINANHPAILMANAYGDSLFGPDQLVDFFGALTGPKRLSWRRATMPSSRRPGWSGWTTMCGPAYGAGSTSTCPMWTPGSPPSHRWFCGYVSPARSSSTRTGHMSAPRVSTSDSSRAARCGPGWTPPPMPESRCCRTGWRR